MEQHVLSLEAPTTMNDCVLRLVDTSVYSNIIPVECPNIDILYPGFSTPIKLEKPLVGANFMLNLTACDLGLQTTGCGSEYAALSDGVYTIRYSVAPNDQVYVEYDHLRITQALKKYNAVLCELDVNGCLPTYEVEKKLQELRMIRMYLDAAKAKVETCHELSKGMEIYNYAMKLLGKFDCSNCQ
jgi:hypothetical protein